jgi:hypothetical protein
MTTGLPTNPQGSATDEASADALESMEEFVSATFGLLSLRYCRIVSYLT